MSAVDARSLASRDPARARRLVGIAERRPIMGMEGFRLVIKDTGVRPWILCRWDDEQESWLASGLHLVPAPYRIAAMVIINAERPRGD